MYPFVVVCKDQLPTHADPFPRRPKTSRAPHRPPHTPARRRSPSTHFARASESFLAHAPPPPPSTARSRVRPSARDDDDDADAERFREIEQRSVAKYEQSATIYRELGEVLLELY